MSVLEKLKTQGISGVIESGVNSLWGKEGIYKIYTKKKHYPRSKSSRMINILITGDVQFYPNLDSIHHQRYKNYRIIHSLDDLDDEDYILRIPHNYILKPWALDLLSMVDAEITYFDEDINGKLPHFKSHYNPYLLRSYNYIGEAIYCKKKYIHLSTYELALQYPFNHLSAIIGTIDSFDYYFNHLEENRKILSDYLNLEVSIEDRFFHVHYPALGLMEGISVIIPNKDHIEDLDLCLKTLKQYHTMPLDIIIMENNSVEKKTFDYYKSLKNETIFYYKGEFNYARINNQALNYCKYQNILFLNNDIIFHEDVLTRMLQLLKNEDVGIVGARLFYPDHTLQHAGIFLGIDDQPFHALSGCSNDPFYRDKLTANYMAVTGAVMMIKKDLWKKIGLFDEAFEVAYNDIDLCLKSLQQNKLVVLEGTTNITHAESKSRGLNTTPEKQARFQKEINLFRMKWKDFLEKGDPYYNPEYSRIRVDYSPRIRKEGKKS